MDHVPVAGHGPELTLELLDRVDLELFLGRLGLGIRIGVRIVEGFPVVDDGDVIGGGGRLVVARLIGGGLVGVCLISGRQLVARQIFAGTVGRRRADALGVRRAGVGTQLAGVLEV